GRVRASGMCRSRSPCWPGQGNLRPWKCQAHCWVTTRTGWSTSYCAPWGMKALVSECLAEVAHALSRDEQRPPRSTGGFDVSPPAGEIGVSLWVRADSAGDAVDKALRIVKSAATTVTGKYHPLWDMRIVPGTAIFGRSELHDSSRSSEVLRSRGSER